MRDVAIPTDESNRWALVACSWPDKTNEARLSRENHDITLRNPSINATRARIVMANVTDTRHNYDNLSETASPSTHLLEARRWLNHVAGRRVSGSRFGR